MCYYSTTLHKNRFRAAKMGENLVISHSDHHTYVKATSDGKIVCIKPGTKVHVTGWVYGRKLTGAVGTFRQSYGRYSADTIVLNDGDRFGLCDLDVGTKLYLGKKKVTRKRRPSLVKRLGLDDPSIRLDHRTEGKKRLIKAR